MRRQAKAAAGKSESKQVLQVCATNRETAREFHQDPDCEMRGSSYQGRIDEFKAVSNTINHGISVFLRVWQTKSCNKIDRRDDIDGYMTGFS